MEERLFGVLCCHTFKTIILDTYCSRHVSLFIYMPSPGGFLLWWETILRMVWHFEKNHTRHMILKKRLFIQLCALPRRSLTMPRCHCWDWCGMALPLAKRIKLDSWRSSSVSLLNCVPPSRGLSLTIDEMPSLRVLWRDTAERITFDLWCPRCVSLLIVFVVASVAHPRCLLRRWDAILERNVTL